MGAPIAIDPSLDVEHAVNRVLAAERTALAAVEDCRKQAQRRLEQARHDSRRILDRAEERSGRVHALAERALAARLAELRAESATVSDRPLVEEDDLARVHAVVPLLVAELTGQGV